MLRWENWDAHGAADSGERAVDALHCYERFACCFMGAATLIPCFQGYRLYSTTIGPLVNV